MRFYLPITRVDAQGTEVRHVKMGKELADRGHISLPALDEQLT